jgi:hypothetical protein
VGDRIENIQVLLVVRNQRMNGPTSSEAMNDTIEEISHDLSGLSDQWNNRLVPLTTSLPDGSVSSSVDAFINGLDGANMYVEQNASTTVNPSYYSISLGRAHTIFEQFENVYTTISELQENLENQINSLAVTASQIAIEDGDNLYAAANVETALAEAMTKIDLVSSLNFNAVGENILPDTDDTYDLGDSGLRWRNLYLGPASLHIIATAAQAGGTSRDYKLEVDSTSGDLLFKEGATQIFSMSAVGEVSLGSDLTIPNDLTVQNDLSVSGDVTSVLKLTSQLLISAGTEALPGLAGYGDPDTGIFLPLADTLAFSTNGIERWQINASGHLVAQGVFPIYTGNIYGWAGDTDTFIDLPSPNVVGIQCGGTVSATFQTGGLEIGEGDADMQLIIFGDQGAEACQLYSSGSNFGVLDLNDDGGATQIKLSAETEQSYIKGSLRVGDASTATTQAVLDLDNASNLAMRLPILSTAEMNALSEEGLFIYNVSLKKVYVRTNTTWVALH